MLLLLQLLLLLLKGMISMRPRLILILGQFIQLSWGRQLSQRQKTGYSTLQELSLSLIDTFAYREHKFL